MVVVLNRRPHKQLLVWQKSVDLTVLLYKLTESFPREEEFGLKSQIRRAAISVPSNIAEGLTRRSAKEKRHFLNIADASLSEIDTHLEVAHRLNLIDEATFNRTENELIEVQKLLSGLLRVIK